MRVDLVIASSSEHASPMLRYIPLTLIESFKNIVSQEMVDKIKLKIKALTNSMV